MAYFIDLVGLINVFDQGASGRLLLLPDGRQSGLNVPSHVANILVLEPQLIDSQAWASDSSTTVPTPGVLSFPIEESVTISITGLESGGMSELDASGWDGLVPMLRHPEINIVPDEAVTIARIPISRGKLDAFSFAGDSVAGRLTLEHAGNITITASSNGGAVKTLTVLDGAEIVITNLSRRGAALPNPTADEESHFKLYGQLDVERRTSGLAEPAGAASGLQHLPSGHPYLAFIRANGGALPTPGCSVTGGP